MISRFFVVVTRIKSAGKKRLIKKLINVAGWWEAKGGPTFFRFYNFFAIWSTIYDKKFTKIYFYNKKFKN